MPLVSLARPEVPAAREDSILFGAGVAFGERGGLAGQASSETLTFPFGRSLRSRLHRKHRSPRYLTPRDSIGKSLISSPASRGRVPAAWGRSLRLLKSPFKEQFPVVTRRAA